MRTKEEILAAGAKTRFTKENQPKNKGRKKKLPALDVLLADVLGGEDPNTSEAHEVLKAMLKEAKKGNVQAGVAILNRAFGMPKQQHEHTGQDGGPIRHDFSSLSSEEMDKMAEIIEKTQSA